MGSDKKTDKEAFDSELPQHKVALPEYYIARYPVTVAQFTAFVEQSGYQPGDEDCLKDPLTRPVRYVSWREAIAYCAWLDQSLRAKADLPAELKSKLQQGWKITLPTEAQWEKAARGADARIYPWGNVYDASKANIRDTGIIDTSAAGCFPAGASPYGILDMIGNVLEWTRSEFKPYPYDCQDGREDLQSDASRALRGGAFLSRRGYARCAFRNYDGPGGRGGLIGFRVALVSPIFHL